MAKIWLITGSGNRGPGHRRGGLAAGDSVVAGARRTEEPAPLVAQYGERLKPVTLEVRDEAAAKAAVQLAVDTFGRLDVLVNNAGYGQFAPFEQMSGEDFQAVVVHVFMAWLHNTRRRASDAQTQERSHLSGVFGRWSPRGCWQHSVLCDQVGRGRFQRFSGNGSRAVRGQGLHTGAGRYSDQPGASRRSECAGTAAGLPALGRWNSKCIARPRRTFGRRSAEDRECNRTTRKWRRRAGAAHPRCGCRKAGTSSGSGTCARGRNGDLSPFQRFLEMGASITDCIRPGAK
jgi:hypothetical protein